MQIRTSEATWDGTLQDGKGRFWTESGEVSGVFTFPTRFEDQPGTNPEELIGAALASCFRWRSPATWGAPATRRSRSAPSRWCIWTRVSAGSRSPASTSTGSHSHHDRVR